MFLRLFLFLQLISLMGPGSRANASEPAERRTGTEPVGRVVEAVVIIGAIILIVVVILGFLSIAGDFKLSHLDPRT